MHAANILQKFSIIPLTETSVAGWWRLDLNIVITCIEKQLNFYKYVATHAGINQLIDKQPKSL